MLMSVRHRQWKLAKNFYKELQELDNMLLLGLRWVYLKSKRLFPVGKKRDNSFLFTDFYPVGQLAAGEAQSK